MKKYVGIWLDHRQAYVVYISRNQPAVGEDDEMIEGIESDVERRVRLSGGARTRKTPYGPQDIAVDGKQQARINHQLGQYFKKIRDRISDADQILIFGPGEAKFEFVKAIEKSDQMAKKIVKIEPAEKMTVKQVQARVRKFFKPQL